LIRKIKKVFDIFFKYCCLYIHFAPRKNNGELVYLRSFPEATYAPWFQDIFFYDTYTKIKKYSLKDIYRLYELYSLATQACNYGGSFVEIGAWRGGSAAIIASAKKKMLNSNDFYLCDTFEGVVKASFIDNFYNNGEHNDTDLNYVNKVFDKLNLMLPKVLTGIFPDDTGNEVSDNVSFLHIDVDTYQSAKDIFNFCQNKFTDKAVIIFDDYGFFETNGITILCNELKNKKNMTFIHNLNGHGIFLWNKV